MSVKALPRMAVAAVATVALLNALAYRHAYRMSHFVAGGTRTAGPEQLSAMERAAVLLTGVRLPRPESDTTPADVGLDFTALRFPSGHGPELAAWRVVTARPQGLVVLFHGYDASKASLLPQARILSGLGYETLLVDFFGSGGSTGSSTTLGVLEAKDVAAALDVARRERVAPIVLYGISMGGASGLRAVAVEGARPDALIVESTYDRLLSTVRNRFRSMSIPSWPAAEMLLFWGGWQEDVDLFGHDPVTYAASVDVPTLVVQGADDPRVTLAEARRLAAALGANGSLHVFPGLGHVTIAAAAPDEWRSVVGDFLAAHRPAR